MYRQCEEGLAVGFGVEFDGSELRLERRSGGRARKVSVVESTVSIGQTDRPTSRPEYRAYMCVVVASFDKCQDGGY